MNGPLTLQYHSVIITSAKAVVPSKQWDTFSATCIRYDPLFGGTICNINTAILRLCCMGGYVLAGGFVYHHTVYFSIDPRPRERVLNCYRPSICGWQLRSRLRRLPTQSSVKPFMTQFIAVAKTQPFSHKWRDVNTASKLLIWLISTKSTFAGGKFQLQLCQIEIPSIQGCTKGWAPGCVKMRQRICVLLPAEG